MLRRTANDLIRRVASGEAARAITGHVTVAMTDHYAHVDTAEKRRRSRACFDWSKEAGAKQPRGTGPTGGP